MTWDTGEAPKKKRKKMDAPTRADAAAKPPGSKPDGWGDAGKIAQTRTRRRLVAIVGASAVGLVALVLLAAPLVAGATAPGIIADAASSGIAGRVEVDRVRLGWFRGQVVEDARLFDPDGDRVASVDVRVDRGLLGVLLGGLDVGVVELSGRAEIVRDADGVTNLERAVAPAAGAASDPGDEREPGDAEPIRVPASLRAEIDITALNITYADPALLAASGGTIGVVKAADLTGRLRIGGGDIGVRLDGDVRTAARDDDDGSAPAGSAELRLTLGNAIDGDGVLRIGPGLDPAETAGVDLDARIELSELSVALLDAFGAQGGTLVEGLGDAVSLTFEADGPGDAIEATLRVDSAAVEIDGSVLVDLAAARVRSASPITVSARTARLVAFAGEAVAALERDSGVAIGSWPEAGVTLRDLDLPLPLGAGPIDLRGAGAVVEVALGPSAATAPSPDPGAAPWDVRTGPLSFTVEARDLAAGFSLIGEAAARINGTDAGTLAVNLRLADLLDAAGAVRTDGVPTVTGTVSATNVALGLVQPLVDGTGLVLSRDVGRTMNLTANASPGPAGGRRIALEARASNVVATAGVLVSARGDRVALDDTGARIELRSIGPTATRLAQSAGVEVVSAQPFVLTVDRFDAPVAGLTGGDLRDLGVSAAIAFGETTGWVTLPEAGATGRRHVTLTGARIAVDARRLGDGVRLRLNGDARVDNRPAGGVGGDLFIAGVLTPAGAPAGGVPSSFSGEVRLTELATEVLQPLVTEAGLVLSEDIGPTVDVRIRANAGEVGSPTGGATDLVVTLASERANARAELSAGEQTVRTTGDGVSFRHDGTGRLAARVAGLLAAESGLAIDRAGGLSVAVPRLRLPVDPVTRAPRLDDAEATFEAALSDVVLVGADGARLGLDRMELAGGLSAGRGLDVRLEAGLRSGERPFSLSLSAAVPDLIDRPSDSARATLTLRDMPAAVVGLFAAPIEAPDGGTVGAAEVLTGFVGETLTLRLESEPAGGGGAAGERTARAQLSGASVTLDARAGLSMPADAPAGLTSFAVDGALEVSPAAFTRALRLAGVDPRGAVDAASRGPARAAPARGADARVASPAAPLRLDEPVALRLSGRLRERDRVEIELRTDRIAISGLEAFAKTPRPVGPVVADVVVRAAGPFSPDAAAMTGRASLRLESSIRSSTGDALAAITADGSVPISAGEPRGRATLRASAEGVDAAFVDRVLGGDGLVDEALGGTASVRLDSAAELAGGSVRTASATLTPDAPRLRVIEPIRVAVRDDAAVLSSPFDLEWAMTPELATGLLTPAPDASGEEPRPPVRIVSATTWRVRGDELRVPLGEAPGAPPVRAGVSVVGSALRVRLDDGRELVYPSTTLSARSDETGRVMALNAEITGGTTGRALVFTGRVEGLDAEEPTLTGRGELAGLATALVDAFAGGGGRIVNVLGETVRGSVDVQRFPALGGTLTLSGSTPNGELEYAGVVRDPTGGAKRLVATEDAVVRLGRVDEIAAGEMRDFVPAFARLDKRPEEHEPALVRITRLSLPFEGGLTEVEAEATVDPGEFGFSIDGGLQSLLKATGQATDGRLLERFGAVEVTLRNGVATYDKLNVPIGEYEFESSGVFDLVAQTEQVTLWTPLPAIAAENLRLPGLDAQNVINPDAVVPIRKSGPLGNKDNPWRLDLSGARGQLVRPADLKDVGRGLIKDLLGGGG